MTGDNQVESKGARNPRLQMDFRSVFRMRTVSSTLVANDARSKEMEGTVVVRLSRFDDMKE